MCKARRLKLIGDPETRYREDPVRMLRAVRFAAKLDFSIEPETEAPISRLAYLLDGVPPARLFDEVPEIIPVRIRRQGVSAAAEIRTVRAFVSAVGRGLRAAAVCLRARKCSNAGSRTPMRASPPTSRSRRRFCSRCCCGARCCASSTSGRRARRRISRSSCRPATRCCSAQQSRVAIPRRFAMPMRELLMLQPRFNRRSGVKSLSLLQHPRFRAAYDFLLLRAQVGVADPELAKWWTDIQVLPQEERVALVQARPAEPVAAGRHRGARAGAAAAGGAAERRAR